MKKFALQILINLSKKFLKAKKPTIIGITGSYGKTSTKIILASILSEQFRVSFLKKNFNNEFGLPLSILGIDKTPGRNPFAWIAVICKGIIKATPLSKGPEMLILEYGIDAPNDMDFLLSIAVPDIAIITGIGNAHYQNFESSHGIWEEKMKLAEAVSDKGTVYINASIEQKPTLKAKLITYGLDDGSQDMHADYLVKIIEQQLGVNARTEFEIKEQGQSTFFHGSVNLMSKASIMPVALGIIIAKSMGMVNAEIDRVLPSLKSLPSRLHFLAGKSGSLILDDTYNASLESVVLGLDISQKVEKGNKILFLGDMLELGEAAISNHESLLPHILAVKASDIYLVGPMMARLKEPLSLSANVYTFVNSTELLANTSIKLNEADFVYVKGSQGMRMEKIVVALMAEPLQAPNMICRQDLSWLR